jgi:hypothetical protein
LPRYVPVSTLFQYIRPKYPGGALHPDASRFGATRPGNGASQQLFYYLGTYKREYVVEFKIYNGPKYFRAGKAQLAYYANRLGLKTAEYVVFMPEGTRLRPELVNEDPETVDGVYIRIWFVPYDEEKDF